MWPIEFQCVNISRRLKPEKPINCVWIKTLLLEVSWAIKGTWSFQKSGILSPFGAVFSCLRFLVMLPRHLAQKKGRGAGIEPNDVNNRSPPISNNHNINVNKSQMLTPTNNVDIYSGINTDTCSNSNFVICSTNIIFWNLSWHLVAYLPVNLHTHILRHWFWHIFKQIFGHQLLYIFWHIVWHFIWQV